MHRSEIFAAPGTASHPWPFDEFNLHERSSVAVATEHVDDAPARTSKHSDEANNVVGRAVTINRPARELYAYWRDFSNLATFMENIVSIDVLDAGRSHWVVKAPMGQTVEWDAVVTEDREGEMIAWTSENADVPNGGRVEFRDAGARGTVVSATIAYYPPAGIVGKVVAKVLQREPGVEMRRDLRRFKQLMETGEIATNVKTRAEREKEGA